MAKKVDVRDISPFLQKIRNFLLGRNHTKALRFEKDLATRTPPLPDIPDGPSHRLHTNYYYTRDARREVQPPTIIASHRTLLPSPEAPAGSLRKPGNVYHWD